MEPEVLRVRRGFWRGLRSRLPRLRRRGTRGRTQAWRTWAAVGVAFVAVVVLGVAGFTRYQQSLGVEESLASRLYGSLQLFVLEGGAVAGPVPWELQLARFAAPVVAGYALLQALAVLFREQLDSLRLQLARRHVVVAGLGHMGRLIAGSLLDAGRPVVVIEADATNPVLAAIRAAGALVVIGDARTPDALRRARLDRADQLVVLCGGDIVNAEVVATARELATERRYGWLRCVAHMVDPELCLLLTSEELERYGQAPIRVDFVNVYAVGALAILQAHPPFPERNGAASRVAIIGAGATARHLVVALARACAVGMPHDGPRLPVAVGSTDASAIGDPADGYPEVARFLDLQPAADPVASMAAFAPEIAYICPDDDPFAVSTTLRLRSLLAGRPTRIVTVLAQRAGLARLLDGAPPPAGGPSAATLGLLDEACQPDLLLIGTTELLARGLHQAYLNTYGDRGTGGRVVAGADPALRPWTELPEHLRESNRDQAAHVAVKLRAIRAGIGPLVDWDRAQAPFSPAEVETMARLEHDRWAAERRRAGWLPGPRDPERRTSPFLVPWDELQEADREKDRVFIRQLPRLLASVGLQAHRRDMSAGQMPKAEQENAPARTDRAVVEA